MVTSFATVEVMTMEVTALGILPPTAEKHQLKINELKGKPTRLDKHTEAT
jgi:hypothetical protein